MRSVLTEAVYAFSGSENSRHGVNPLRTMYSTCLVISSSESGGKKEKVSKNLLLIGVHTCSQTNVKKTLESMHQWAVQIRARHCTAFGVAARALSGAALAPFHRRGSNFSDAASRRKFTKTQIYVKCITYLESRCLLGGHIGHSLDWGSLGRGGLDGALGNCDWCASDRSGDSNHFELEVFVCRNVRARH